MKKPGMKHPLKKKHVTRPREEVIRLTREQQLDKAAAARKKAVGLLGDADLLARQGVASAAAVHSAYMAMEWAAVAVLLIEGGVDKYGDVPGSHAHIIDHFGKIVKAKAQALQYLVEAIERGRNRRVVGDYDLIGIISPRAASELAADATKFLEGCVAQWPMKN